MYSKSKYLWLTISLISFFYIVARQITLIKNVRLVSQSEVKVKEAEVEAAKGLESYNVARMETQNIKMELHKKLFQ